MLDLITAAILLVGLTIALRRRPPGRERRNDQVSRAIERAAGRGDPGAGTVTALASQGPDGVLVSRDARFNFIGAFGLEPAALTELHVYSRAGRFAEFPQKIIALLALLHSSGHAVGPEIMALIHHERPLAEGEAVYIAVFRDARNGERTTAFLDRYRPG